MNIETAHLDVPRDFEVACGLFGIPVPGFLQLIVDHCCFIHAHMGDTSEFDMATKAFLEADRQLGEKEIKPATHLSESQRERFIRLLRQMVGTATNRNYSKSTRRKKGKVLAEKLFDTFSAGLEIKDVVYYDEETKIQLSKDFLLMTLLHQRTPIELLNAIMKRISYAELGARVHLKQEDYNPAMVFFTRVMEGYGGIRDETYLESEAFKIFLMDLQEFRARYFFYRNLEDRIYMYRERLEENYQRIKNPYLNEDYD